MIAHQGTHCPRSPHWLVRHVLYDKKRIGVVASLGGTENPGVEHVCGRWKGVIDFMENVDCGRKPGSLEIGGTENSGVEHVCGRWNEWGNCYDGIGGSWHTLHPGTVPWTALWSH